MGRISDEEQHQADLGWPGLTSDERKERIKVYLKKKGGYPVENTTDDVVNHPPHYQSGGLEVIDVIEAFGLDRDFYLGNTIKYILRHNKKSNPLEDLKKSRWYLDRKIKNMEANKVNVDEVKLTSREGLTVTWPGNGLLSNF